MRKPSQDQQSHPNEPTLPADTQVSGMASQDYPTPAEPYSSCLLLHGALILWFLTCSCGSGKLIQMFCSLVFPKWQE